MRHAVIEDNLSLSALEHENTDVLQKPETTLSNQQFSKFFHIFQMSETQVILQI